MLEKTAQDKVYAFDDNIPFTSDSYLKISAKGVEEDDFVMILGYPGTKPNRLLTFNQREYRF